MHRPWKHGGFGAQPFLLQHPSSAGAKAARQLLPDVGAREISNILWSSAKLGLNPDAFVPGMTDALAAKLLQDLVT